MSTLQETASPLEVYVTLVALFGSLISLGLLVSAWLDLGAAWSLVQPNDPDVTIAWGNLAQEGLRLGCLLALVTMGVDLMLTPPLSGRVDVPSSTGLTLVLGMLVIEHLLVAKSVIGWWVRRRLSMQTELLRDPCADCPWGHSPFKDKAQSARTKRERIGKPPVPRLYADRHVDEHGKAVEVTVPAESGAEVHLHVDLPNPEGGEPPRPPAEQPEH